MKEILSKRAGPNVVLFSDLGLDFAEEQIDEVATWIFENARRVTLDHSHPSSRDVRVNSIIRKTPGILFSDEELPKVVVDVVEAIYTASCNYATRYLGRVVLPWETRYAAIGHLYLPGDDATEGHVDQMASATAYFRQPSKGRRLHIARDESARSIEDILENSHSVLPQEGHIVFFDGQVLPHFVEGVPIDEAGCGISVNMSMDDGVDPNGLIEYGYFDDEQ